MLAQLVPFAFLGIFELIGGLVAGDGLHKLFVDRMPRGIMLVIWGMFFGGIPALLAVVRAAEIEQPLLRAVGPLVFVAALLSGFLLLPWLAQELGAGTLITLSVGFVFMLSGGGMAVAILRAGTGATIIGLLVSAFFAGVGVLLCWNALSALIWGESLDKQQTAERQGMTIWK
jgi:hypothetical protein